MEIWVVNKIVNKYFFNNNGNGYGNIIVMSKLW